jgi:flagella basal body P-ring formation protein FlgA
LFIDRQYIKTINVVGEVRAQATVTAPTRWIKPREVMIAEDVTTMTVDVPSLTHDFILHPDEVIGKQVLRPLPPRQPIRKVMLDDPPVVRKGDRVMIEARRGGLVVQAVGLANAAGKSGDTISVKNTSSGREVIGTILSAGLVEVGFCAICYGNLESCFGVWLPAWDYGDSWGVQRFNSLQKLKPNPMCSWNQKRLRWVRCGSQTMVEPLCLKADGPVVLAIS